MERNRIFRDTENYYLQIDESASILLINFTKEEAGETILDVGCATGEYCHELNKLGYKCTGIDINPEYIKSADKRGIESYIMDAKNLDFPNNSFDTVLLFEVLEHVDDPSSILNEAKRVAKKNILITVPNLTNFWN